MTPYTYGLAVLAILAAIAVGAALLFKRRSLRGSRDRFENEDYVRHSDFHHWAKNIRHELQQSIEASEARARRAATIGEKIIAAVKPIELALRDLGRRIGELEQRADASATFLSELKLSAEEQQNSSEDNAHTVKHVSVRLLEGFERQLMAVTDQLATVMRVVGGITAQDAESSEALQAVNARMAEVQKQVESLSQRVDLGDSDQIEALAVAKSIGESFTCLKATSDDTAQRVVDLERCVLSKLAELERRLNSTPTNVNVRPTEDVKDKSENGPANVSEHTNSNHRSNDSDDRAGDAPALLDVPHGAVNDGQVTGNTCGDHIAPGDRGGGSREERKTTTRYVTAVEMTSLPKLALVATRDSGEWQIFAEIDSDEPSNFLVVQGSDTSHPLNEPQPSLFGPLRDLTTAIQVLCDGVKLTERLLGTEDSPLLFFRVCHNLARFVRRPSRGLHLAVAPSHWRYNEKKSGAPPVEPETIDVPGYSVHFFSADRNPTLSFDRPGELPVEFCCAESNFQLVGHCMPDAEEGMGPLFSGELPSLSGDDGSMNSVRTMVLGAEGRGAGRWRRQYECNRNALEHWPLSNDVREQGSGWYFVRLYDPVDNLIDSLDFRYVAGLKSIDVAGAGLKQNLGDSQVRVTFGHDPDVSVNITDLIPTELNTVREPQSTAFAWPSDPNIRNAAFEVRDGGSPVRVTLATDGIWWALATGTQALESTWRSSPLELIVGDFAPTSDASLLIRIPCSSSVAAYVGFDRNDRRALAVRSDGQGTFKLYGFSEAPALVNFGRQKLWLWVTHDSGEVELCVANVTVSKECPWCEAQAKDQREMLDHLLARHHERCFERLNLTGNGVNQSEVSKAIFVCLIDGQYYPDSPLPQENPISLLGQHCNARHPDRMAYKRIDSPQDIRNLLGLKEKWVWKCNLGAHCRPITPPPDGEEALSDKRDHLIEEHLGDLLKTIEVEN